MRHFMTQEEAFQQMVRERVKHETVSIGEGSELRFTYDESHPESMKALGTYPHTSSKSRER